MSVKYRLQKLEKQRGGRRKVYVFKMSDGMDTSAIKEEFCKKRGIEPKANDLFIFQRRFCDSERSWKFLHERDMRS